MQRASYSRTVLPTVWKIPGASLPRFLGTTSGLGLGGLGRGLALGGQVELADHLAVLGVPDEQDAVGSSGGDPFAVVRDGDAEDEVAGTIDRACDLAVRTA